MNPALARESWPQESVAYTESARSPLMPTNAISDWYARSRSRTSGLAHRGLPEEAARPREQHHEEHREGDRVAQGGAEARHREYLDEPERDARHHRAGDAPHAAEDDHRQPLQLHAAANVGRDGVEGQPEEHAGRSAQRAG